MDLKSCLKQYAYELGADLVGFGGVDRCMNAPLMMSPQGVYPKGKTVVVMALHHPDACIELGGEKHPQEIGPYSVQYLMNSRLDEMSYRMATFIEEQGYGAIPIASSNIWRYNEYKSLKAVFAPDISHIYMAVVAGLADMGFSGLAITPEYGARNRFVTVITDAVIDPDPLIPPGTVCDSCMLCRKHCPSQALSKEIKGDKVLKIGPYEYRFPDKNLWRCSWGEHFDLDLDLELPEVVTEEVIKEYVKTYGIRSGEMGQCLKFCVPRDRRSFDKSYTRTPMRINPVSLDESRESRKTMDALLMTALEGGAEFVLVLSKKELTSRSINIEAVLPGSESTVTLLTLEPEETGKQPDRSSPYYAFGAGYQMDSLCYDLTRKLEELGFRSIMTIEQSGSHPDSVEGIDITKKILASFPELKGRRIYANTVTTRKKLPSQFPEFFSKFAKPRISTYNKRNDLTRTLKRFADAQGADLFGIAPAARLAYGIEQIRFAFEDQTALDARDNSIRFTPWDPEVEEKPVSLLTPEDYLPGARSVIVLGLRYHKEVLRWAVKPPAEAVGPYAYETYATNWMSSVLGYKLIKKLESLGHKAVLTMDLAGTASMTANPRGWQPDAFSNRFAALSAGLGLLTRGGHLVTPEFGLAQRFVAVITDAELTASELLGPNNMELFCNKCDDLCIKACPSKAFTGKNVTFSLEGNEYSLSLTDRKKCDWSKKYTLMKESGFGYLGSPVDIAPEQEVQSAELSAALKQLDPVTKYRPVVAEPCLLACPYTEREEA